METGKALRTESRVEASVLADAFTFFGGLGSELKGETVPFSPTIMTMTVREPIGIVGAILPWNVPLLLMALKIAPPWSPATPSSSSRRRSAADGAARVVHLMNTGDAGRSGQHPVGLRAGNAALRWFRTPRSAR